MEVACVSLNCSWTIFRLKNQRNTNDKVSLRECSYKELIAFRSTVWRNGEIWDARSLVETGLRLRLKWHEHENKVIHYFLQVTRKRNRRLCHQLPCWRICVTHWLIIRTDALMPQLRSVSNLSISMHCLLNYYIESFGKFVATLWSSLFILDESRACLVFRLLLEKLTSNLQHSRIVRILLQVEGRQSANCQIVIVINKIWYFS